MMIQRLTVLIFILLTGASTMAQNRSSCKSRFIRSFMETFALSRVDSLKNKQGYYFSILIETNKNGIITSMEGNTALDTILKSLVSETLRNIDASSLTLCEYKNEAIVLPVFVLFETPSSDLGVRYDLKHFNGLWNFKRQSKKQKRFLDPLVIYHADPIKCYTLPPNPTKPYDLILPQERL